MRPLARVEGGSFVDLVDLVDLVDGWLAWHGGPVKRSELGAQLPAFIQHYGKHRHADAHFFLMGAAAERREAPPPAAEVPARG